ncbi:hypothetical protein [Ruminiclostridium josui]|uniref:hypothetical protein n=1 Tax=Ruminiclostridium josui TaxID=1499 RepID=UPI000466A482|nr:hypothetical protein [Ruminiclostridium josui]
MCHIFYILNHSGVDSEKVVQFKEGLKKEFLIWGYSVSEKLEELKTNNVLFIDTLDFNNISKENVSVIVISTDIPDINTSIITAEDFYGMSYKVDAVLFTEGNIQERYRGYQHIQFSPALMMFDFNNINFTDIVAFLINKNSIA